MSPSPQTACNRSGRRRCNSGGVGMLVSEHAKQRAAERFPDRPDLFDYLDTAHIAGQRMRKRIRASCPTMASKYMSGGYDGRYFLVHKRVNAVFVVAAAEPDHVVCTVLRLS